MRNPTRIGVALGASALMAAGAIGSAGAQDELTPIDLQLQWFAQAQFAGFYAADDLGFYEAQGLDVTINETPSDQAPQVLGSQPDGPEFTIAWVPRVLEVRESEVESDLVNIAQHFQRSGTLSVSWADAPVASPEEFADKKVGMWDFGNDYEVIAAGRAAGLEPGDDYERIIQNFDMNAFLNREVDVAEAMIYNEYAQVLETENPETGELYQPEDMVIINYNDVGTAMLQDAIWARESWLAEEGNADIATRFLAASFQGWQFCRDNPDECAEIIANNGSTLGPGHETWMINQINALVWPSPEGVGALPQTPGTRPSRSRPTRASSPRPRATVPTAPTWPRPRAPLEGDVTGEGYDKSEVEVTAGGE